MSGKLIFKYATMNSGKTLDLLRVAHEYRSIGWDVCIFKSSLDTREAGYVKSRTGLKSECSDIKDLENEIGHLEYYPGHRDFIVLIDEAQFLEVSTVETLRRYADSGFKIMAFGLLTDFKRNMFEGSKRLLELCDESDRMVGLCQCGKKSTTVMRLDKDGNPDFEGPVISPGYNYRPLCQKCYGDYKKNYQNELIERGANKWRTTF